MLERQQHAAEALRSNEQQLSAIVTSAPIMVCLMDKSGTFIFAQGKGMESLGLKASDLTGQTIFSDYKPLVEPFMKALGGAALRAEAVFNKVPVQMWLSPLRNQHDNVTGIIGVVTDITPA